LAGQKLISTIREQRKVYILAFIKYYSRMSGPSQHAQTSTRPVISIRRNSQLVPIGDVGGLAEGDVLRADCTQSSFVVNTSHIDYDVKLPDDQNPTKQVTCGITPHTYQGRDGDTHVIVCQTCDFRYQYAPTFLLQELKKHNSES